ncbi:hypothetical protein [Rhodohalobacter sp. SW132]|uniref:hypothetical protein n=1 Tax=Rhodohalobacter sp. SW132 TaxID=2293433 RepID=UPI0013155D08|nr:hypothetical protein [Rhodohalobacter sp. SW132]
MKKKIDAVKFIRQIRDENFEKTKKMSQDEQFADLKKRSAEARKKFLSDSKTIEAK